MKKITRTAWLETASDHVVGFFSVGILALVFLLNLLCTAHVVYDASERVSYGLNWMLVLLPAFIGVLWVLIRGTSKSSETKIFLLGSIFYAAAAGYLILHTEHGLRADALYVFNGAQEVLRKNYESLRCDGYFGMYPHQLGLMVYDIVLETISSDPKILFLANLVEVLVIDWYGYRVAEICFRNEQVNKIVLILEFAFLPQFFYVMFGYGLIPGFCCFMVAFYHVVSMFREAKGQRKNAVLAVLFLTLAVLLKKNYIIGAAALAITAWRLTLNRDWKKRLLLTAALFVIPFLAPAALQKAVSMGTGVAMSQGVPSMAYIAMGTDLENQKRAPGWYNEYNEQVYKEAAHCDSKLAAELSKEKVGENIRESLRNPVRTAKFYLKKVVSTWCDPLFQSVWSGPCPSMGAEADTKIVRSIYTGGKLEVLLQIFAKNLLLVVLGTAWLFLKLHAAEFPELKAGYLYLVGGFLFHLAWETKSQYVYTYVFLLLPMCAYEIWKLKEWSFRRKGREAG